MGFLFVCLGNICRSPLAEALFRAHFTKLKPNSDFLIDSCGTGGWHAGELPDIRMRDTAKSNGLELTHKARQLKLSDFTEFDHLLVMDHENYRNVVDLSPQHKNKVNLITDFSTSYKGLIIPDPYFGNENDFKDVFKLLNEVSSEVAQHFHKQYK